VIERRRTAPSCSAAAWPRRQQNVAEGRAALAARHQFGPPGRPCTGLPLITAVPPPPPRIKVTWRASLK